jgi:hypothetical protein
MVTIPTTVPPWVQDVGLIIPTDGTFINSAAVSANQGLIERDVHRAVRMLRDQGLDTPLVSSRLGYTFTTDQAILSDFVTWWFGSSRTHIMRGGLVLDPVFRTSRAGRRFLRDIARIGEDIEDLISV